MQSRAKARAQQTEWSPNREVTKRSTASRHTRAAVKNATRARNDTRRAKRRARRNTRGFERAVVRTTVGLVPS